MEQRGRPADMRRMRKVVEDVATDVTGFQNANSLAKARLTKQNLISNSVNSPNVTREQLVSSWSQSYSADKACPAHVRQTNVDRSQCHLFHFY